MSCALLSCLRLASCLLVAIAAPTGDKSDPTAQQPPALAFEQLFQVDDRVLFVGDELTQQMFFTRAVAAAVIAMKPDAGLRFFNGGKEGATAHDALNWIDELVKLSRPTVVFICFGLNESMGESSSRIVPAYRQAMSQLVTRVREVGQTRQVILLAPPAVQPSDDGTSQPSGRNQILRQLAVSTYDLAADQQLGFVNLFDHLYTVYLQASSVGGTPLTQRGVLPTEEAHMVIASTVLASVGVEPKRLDGIGWAPMVPHRMRRVRQALALNLKDPNLDMAQASRSVYQEIRRFDELFFRLWRLSGRHPSAKPRVELEGEAERAWANVQAMVRQRYASR